MDSVITAQMILSDAQEGEVYTYKVKDYADSIICAVLLSYILYSNYDKNCD